MTIWIILAAGGLAATDVVDPADVPVGASGVCVTEMDGGERVEIPLTVLGTLGPTSPEGELVLVRLEDPRFAETGIIAGMSGSPVYVDGRLLGALAYGWAFSKEPIGGVTPFARMLELGDQAPGATATGVGRPDPTALAEAVRAGGLGQAVLDWIVPRSGTGLTSLPLPLSVGGPGPGAPGGWLGEAFRRLGWMGVPGGAAPDPPTGLLRPGDMVAGVLVDGDATVAVGGTVTEVRGDQVWAFGHPFLSGGSVAMPMARARVITVLPSQLNSFKFFGVGGMVGALRADRSHGVWGLMGEDVPMVPVRVETAGRTYSFRSLRDPVLLPLLTAYLTQSSYAVEGRLFGEQTVVVTVALTYEGGARAELVQAFAGGDASASAAGLVAALLAYLENGSFAAPALASVDVSLDAEEGLDRAEVVDAVAERSVVRPGETVSVRVRLRRHQGDVTTRRIGVEVPREVPPGGLDLVVADGASWSAYDLQMRPHRASSFADELGLLDRLLPATTLVAVLERPDAGVVLPEGSSPAPTGVILGLRGALGPNMTTTTHRVVAMTELPLDRPVSGALRIRLQVENQRSVGEGS